jgi:hypothetical protein
MAFSDSSNPVLTAPRTGKTVSAMPDGRDIFRPQAS